MHTIPNRLSWVRKITVRLREWVKNEAGEFEPVVTRYETTNRPRIVERNPALKACPFEYINKALKKKKFLN